MTKAPINLQDLRRRVYRQAKSDELSDGDGVAICIVKVTVTRHDP
jgi:hypothetical protein